MNLKNIQTIQYLRLSTNYQKLNDKSLELKPLSLSLVFHLLILLSLLLSFKAKFSTQQIVNIQLIASNNSEKSQSIEKNINQNIAKSNQKKASKNLENVESKAIYNAEYLNNPAPIYPPLAKSRNIEGKVLLEVLVSEKGEASKLKIISSSGSNLLDESAFEAVKNWKFIPAQKFGKNVEATIIVPIEFKII